MEANVKRHRAIVRITYQFMQDLLFPEGTEILSIMADPQDIFGRGDFVCVIEHPDLPVNQLGEQLLTIRPEYRRHFDGIENEIATVTFEGWGIK
jgi:hypothetical protein